MAREPRKKPLDFSDNRVGVGLGVGVVLGVGVGLGVGVELGVKVGGVAPYSANKHGMVCYWTLV